MHTQLEHILADLYQSDPSLKQHDQILRKLVIELLELKPDTHFDESFRQELRRKLMALAETQESKPSLTSNFMKRFQFVGAGVAVLALLVASVWYLNDIKNPASNLTSMLSGPKITRAGDNAFGSLAQLSENNRNQSGGGLGGNTMPMAADSGETAAPAPNGMGSSGSTAVGTDAKMIAPNPVNFRYVYKGEELTLVQDKADVLKRQKNENTDILGDLLNRVSMGLVNLDSFNNTKLQSFSFAEDRDLGYMVNVAVNEGAININENWVKWQAVTMPCMDTMSSVRANCEPKRIDISQIPADQVVIDAANAFLNEHSIPRSAYGEPFVQNDWRVQYERTADKNNYWVPDMLNVVYPLSIEGQQVHEEGGNLTGMNVSVRISPEVRVSSVWDLTTQNYQSSSYEAETDVNRIMGLVEKGGFRNYFYSEPGARTVDVELGTPEVSYVKLWNYTDGTSEELLVPALIFPVTKEPADIDSTYYWYRKNIVIPLVKEILDNENQDNPIRIMPAGATEPAAVEDRARQ
jgi:hypothetical protein